MENADKPPPRGVPGLWHDFRSRVHRLFGYEPQSSQELVDVMQHAQQRGLLNQDELDTIQRVLQVSELRVRDIMIPRSKMVVVDKDHSPEQFLPILTESAHSRFPVIDGDRDKVVGILLAKDVLSYFDKDRKGSFNMREALRPAVFIPESKRLNVLLTEFRASRNHMAVVVDEYGGVAGLVTIEDVLEQIVGEIEDEHDIDEEGDMLLQRGENEFVTKALMPLDEFNEYFQTDFDIEENDTVGGLVVKSFGHVPQRGESVTVDAIQFEVLNADTRRVHLLKVSRVDQPHSLC
ncbi:MAG: transporter associated domain-containing protein [Arenicellales bacterium]|nr:transporter associated domain-containing protein [Arenicellales bacterium]